MKNVHFQDIIRAYMDLGISASMLADELKVSKGTILRWWNGITIPILEVRDEIIDTLIKKFGTVHEIYKVFATTLSPACDQDGIMSQIIEIREHCGYKQYSEDANKETWKEAGNIVEQCYKDLIKIGAVGL
jgi:predicted transcriptional regulator